MKRKAKNNIKRMQESTKQNEVKKLCGRCGTQNDNAARYCWKCGAEIPYIAQTLVRPKKKMMKVVTMMGILITTAIFGGIAGLLWKKGAEDKLHQSAVGTFGYIYNDKIYYMEDASPANNIVMFDQQGNKEIIYHETYGFGNINLYGARTLWGQGEKIYWEERYESNDSIQEYRIMKMELDNREITQVLSGEEYIEISGVIGENLYYTVYNEMRELWVYDLSENSKKKITESEGTRLEGRFYIYDQNTCLFSKKENDMFTTYAVSLETGEFEKLEEFQSVFTLIYEDGVIYGNVRDSEEIISINFSNDKKNEYNVEGNLMSVSGDYMLIEKDNKIIRYNMKSGECYELKLNDEEIERNKNNPDYVSGWLSDEYCGTDTDIVEYHHFSVDYKDSLCERYYFIDNNTGDIYKFQGKELEYMSQTFIYGGYLFYNTFVSDTFDCTAERVFLKDFIAEEKWEKVSG